MVIVAEVIAVGSHTMALAAEVEEGDTVDKAEVKGVIAEVMETEVIEEVEEMKGMEEAVDMEVEEAVVQYAMTSRAGSVVEVIAVNSHMKIAVNAGKVVEVAPVGEEVVMINATISKTEGAVVGTAADFPTMTTVVEIMDLGVAGSVAGADNEVVVEVAHKMGLLQS